MLDTETRVRLKETIRQHLATNGPKEWDLVRQQFPHIPTATLWRHIARVKAEPTPKSRLDDSKTKIAEALAQVTADERRAAAVATMPCVPSPAYIAKSGSDGIRHLNLLARLNGLMDDVDRVREHAMNDAGEIVDVEVFAESIDVGIKLIGAAIKSIDSVFDQRHLLGFYDAIVDEIAKESPETSGRIIARLRELDEARGYSFATKPSGLAP